MPNSVKQIGSGINRQVALVDAQKATIIRTNLTQRETDAALEFHVALKLRNIDELEKRIEKGEILSRSEMARRYFPAEQDRKAVADWLKGQGFQIVGADPSRLGVFAKGTIGQIRQAFSVAFGRVALRGKEYTSAVTIPSVPAALAPPILAINGLQPHIRMHTLSPSVPYATPYAPSDLLKTYNANGLTVTGAGQTIAIVTGAIPNTNDLVSFWSNCSVTQSLSNIQLLPQVNSGTLSPPGSQNSMEATLDVEWSSAIAPGAKVRVYPTAGSGMDGLIDPDQAYAQIISDLPSQPSLHQVSISYGTGETEISQGQAQTDEQYFATMAAFGVTVFASSGDWGSSFTDTTIPTNAPVTSGGFLQVLEPASCPDVTGVGGTSLTLNATTGAVTSETAWTGSGGGISTWFAMPAWQTPYTSFIGEMRMVPDVSSSADPGRPAYVVWNGGVSYVGGTSWAAPTWAGFCALMNQARAKNGLPPLGLLGPKIYPLLGTSCFRDIISGSNGPSGIYNAGVGYDLVTGLGVPNVTSLIEALCPPLGQPSLPLLTNVPLGGEFTLSPIVTDTGVFTYQWQFDGTNLPSGNITTVAGNGIGTLAGDGNIATNGSLYRPAGVALDAAGNLFIADSYNHRVRKVSTTGIMTTIAGIGPSYPATGSYSGDGRAATNAGLSFPRGVALDRSGNLFIADSGNNLIRKVGTNGIISTVAGNTLHGYFGDGQAAIHASLALPTGVAVDSAGDIFIADSDNNLVREVLTSGVITTVAGDGPYAGPQNGNPSGFSGDDVLATKTSLYSPSGVVVDGMGNLYVADKYNNRIRKVGANGIITPVVGDGPSFPSLGGYSGDGFPAIYASLYSPCGVALDALGNVYICDSINNAVRKVNGTGIIMTVAGDGPTGVGSFAGDGQSATNASLNSPLGIAFDASGNLYIADELNNRVRKVYGQSPSLQINDAASGNAGTYDVVITSPYGSVTSTLASVGIVLPMLNASILTVPGGRDLVLQFNGNPGSNYVLEMATNLALPTTWQPVFTNAADINGNWSFSATNALSYQARFYRLTVP